MSKQSKLRKITIDIIETYKKQIYDRIIEWYYVEDSIVDSDYSHAIDIITQFIEGVDNIQLMCGGISSRIISKMQGDTIGDGSYEYIQGIIEDEIKDIIESMN